MDIDPSLSVKSCSSADGAVEVEDEDVTVASGRSQVISGLLELKKIYKYLINDIINHICKYLTNVKLINRVTLCYSNKEPLCICICKLCINYYIWENKLVSNLKQIKKYQPFIMYCLLRHNKRPTLLHFQRYFFRCL